MGRQGYSGSRYGVVLKLTPGESARGEASGVEAGQPCGCPVGVTQNAGGVPATGMETML